MNYFRLKMVDAEKCKQFSSNIILVLWPPRPKRKLTLESFCKSCITNATQNLMHLGCEKPSSSLKRITLWLTFCLVIDQKFWKHFYGLLQHFLCISIFLCTRRKICPPTRHFSIESKLGGVKFKKYKINLRLCT